MSSHRSDRNCLSLFISIWIFQLFSVIGWADDLRDQLLPGVTPLIQALRQRELTGESARGSQGFALRAKLNDLSQLTQSELELILANRDLITRVLLVEIDERALFTFELLLKKKVDAGSFNAHRAYFAALSAKALIDLGLARRVPINVGFMISSDETTAWQTAGHAARKALYFDYLKGLEEPFRSFGFWELVFSSMQNDWSRAMVETMDAALPIYDSGGWTARDALWNLPAVKELPKENIFPLAELALLDWVAKNAAHAYEKVFQTAYERASDSIEIVITNKIFEPLFNDARLAENPFVIEFRYFRDEIEKEIKALDPDSPRLFQMCLPKGAIRKSF